MFQGRRKRTQSYIYNYIWSRNFVVHWRTMTRKAALSFAFSSHSEGSSNTLLPRTQQIYLQLHLGKNQDVTKDRKNERSTYKRAQENLATVAILWLRSVSQQHSCTKLTVICWGEKRLKGDLTLTANVNGLYELCLTVVKSATFSFHQGYLFSALKKECNWRKVIGGTAAQPPPASGVARLSNEEVLLSRVRWGVEETAGGPPAPSKPKMGALHWSGTPKMSRWQSRKGMREQRPLTSSCDTQNMRSDQNFD